MPGQLNVSENRQSLKIAVLGGDRQAGDFLHALIAAEHGYFQRLPVFRDVDLTGPTQFFR